MEIHGESWSSTLLLAGTVIKLPHSERQVSAMRIRIVAIVGALIGAFILVVATPSVNGTTLHSL